MRPQRPKKTWNAAVRLWCCWGPKAEPWCTQFPWLQTGFSKKPCSALLEANSPWGVSELSPESEERGWWNTASSTQFRRDGHTQDKCCHIVGDLAHAYKDKQHGEHLEVLGEDLQEAEARLHAHGHKQHVLPTKPGKERGVTEAAGRRRQEWAPPRGAFPRATQGRVTDSAGRAPGAGSVPVSQRLCCHPASPLLRINV